MVVRKENLPQLNGDSALSMRLSWPTQWRFGHNSGACTGGLFKRCAGWFAAILVVMPIRPTVRSSRHFLTFLYQSTWQSIYIFVIRKESNKNQVSSVRFWHWDCEPASLVYCGLSGLLLKILVGPPIFTSDFGGKPTAFFYDLVWTVKYIDAYDDDEKEFI